MAKTETNLDWNHEVKFDPTQPVSEEFKAEALSAAQYTKTWLVEPATPTQPEVVDVDRYPMPLAKVVYGLLEGSRDGGLRSLDEFVDSTRSNRAESRATRRAERRERRANRRQGEHANGFSQVEQN